MRHEGSKYLYFLRSVADGIASPTACSPRDYPCGDRLLTLCTVRNPAAVRPRA